MEYEFDFPVRRENCGNTKYITALEKLKQLGAMSYTGAEMDFKTAPVIIDALEKCSRSGIFGYTASNDETYLEKVVNWMKKVRKWDIEKEWIVPTYGTVSAITIAVQAFTDEGDGVIVQSPCFSSYKKLLQQNNRNIMSNKMIYSNGKYFVDFDDLEMLMRDEKAKLLILCNPHNPTTKIFTPEELSKIAKLAKKNNVVVISDEIFAELTFQNKIAIPFANAEYAFDNCIICSSIGKAFNFVGTNHANIIIPSEKIRSEFIEQRNRNHYGSMSPFMYTSIISAYSNEGKKWLDALIEYVAENINIFEKFIKNNMPDVKIVEHEAGCLIWVDWNGLGLSNTELRSFLEEEAVLDVNYGENYGDEWQCFTRVAVGTPKNDLKNALDRLYLAGKNRGLIK